MRIRQQKQIGIFLAESFGGDRGGALFARQEEILQEIIRNTQNRSKNQRKTLVQTILRSSHLWESEQEHGTDGFSVTMKKCLWHTACVENGCAELCRLFCDVDDVTYGGLCKLGFARTKTLGYGADCCDFRFCRK